MEKTATDDYLKGLNDVQYKAVTQVKGPVLVVAGPGSGKTRVLTYRIAHIIKTGVAPYNILTLTFTNKAAKEMKERISKVVGKVAGQVWAGTFHSIFSRILRNEADKIGYSNNFTIYDTDDSKSLVNAIIKEMNLDKDIYKTNAIRNRISACKSNLVSPTAYKNIPSNLADDKRSRIPYFHVIYERYVLRCKRSDAMDFDDLLFQMYVLLHRHEDIKKKYQERFKYVLVDEFQDTNFLQYEIIKKLVVYPNSENNICAVGDDAQSIYGFRGATIENILNFEKDFKGIQVFKLEQNYRSTEHIVQAANEVISVNKNQIKKSIWASKGDGEKIRLIKTLTDNEEGKRVIDSILEQKNRNHLANSDIAILYRTNSQSRVFEDYLRRYNVPYKVFGGLSFYQRKEVKDILAYFRITINHNDDEALKRTINLPKRAIGKTTVDKVIAVANKNNEPLWNCLLKAQIPKRAYNNISSYQELIKMFGKRLEKLNAYELANVIIKESGLYKMFKGDTTVEGVTRQENVNALLDGISEFVADNEGGLEGSTGLAAFMASVALHTSADEKIDDNNYVTLMSVHSAKGLEFKSVFVVGMEENLFPSFMSTDTPEGIDEERRLFYVAITRAEQFLTLTYSNGRYKFGSMRYNSPSRFLTEIGEKHYDTLIVPKKQASFSKSGAQTSGVSGNFKKSVKASNFKVDSATFVASPITAIQVGKEVLHLSFGKGVVKNIDGGASNKIATIFFEGLDVPNKRIMLKFAKLQVVN